MFSNPAGYVDIRQLSRDEAIDIRLTNDESLMICVPQAPARKSNTLRAEDAPPDVRIEGGAERITRAARQLLIDTCAEIVVY